MSVCLCKRQPFFIPKVIFIRDGNVGRLIVDGLTMLEDSVQGNNVSWHISSPLYVGGVPAGRAQKNIQVQVKICHVKNSRKKWDNWNLIEDFIYSPMFVRKMCGHPALSVPTDKRKPLL